MSVDKIMNEERVAEFWSAVKDYVDEHGGGSGGASVGSDVPIGTVISYMGLTAPDGYLICDGAIYNTADYPKLAEAFADQFGSSRYFGGNGVTTFAVPDMRNLFLRGYHGNAEEQLSGNIGQKQLATQHKDVMTDTSGGETYLYTSINPSEGPGVLNADSFGPSAEFGYYRDGSIYDSYQPEQYYTSRPVNMAVLYCIKATV